jgi:hypothetical protein
LGSNWTSRLMKDYNGQTYWLSFNLRSFLPVNSGIPEWTNVALGYGAEGMTRAREANMGDKNSKRFRRYFVSADADLFRIPADNWIMGSLYLTRFIKAPAPSIEFNSKRKFKLHAIYF